VKILASYLSPSRPVVGADLPPVSAGDCRYWWRATSTQNTWMGTRGWAQDEGNYCVIMPTRTVWSLHRTLERLTHTTPWVFPMSWTSGSDHLPVVIDTTCRSSFQHLPDRPDFRHTDWANFQTHLEDQISFDPQLHNGMAIDTCVDNFSGAVLKALATSNPKRRPRGDTRPAILAGIQDYIRLKSRLRRQLQITWDPALRAEATVCRGRWSAGSTSGGTTSGVPHSNP